MLFRNTRARYGLVAIFFHWLIALLIIALLSLGLYMTQLSISPQKLWLYGLHKEFGITVLGLATLRLLWRMSNTSPSSPAYVPTWQKMAAAGSHLAFYLLMLGMPLTGWLMSSAAGFPVSFFGLFTLPNLVSPDDTLRSLLANVHQFLAYFFIALILLHAGAVLQHALIYKHNLIRRIWP